MEEHKCWFWEEAKKKCVEDCGVCFIFWVSEIESMLKQMFKKRRQYYYVISSRSIYLLTVQMRFRIFSSSLRMPRRRLQAETSKKIPKTNNKEQPQQWPKFHLNVWSDIPCKMFGLFGTWKMIEQNHGRNYKMKSQALTQ